MDASLIRAHVRFDSRVAQHLEAATDADPDAAGRLSWSSGKDKTLCVTDPKQRWRPCRRAGICSRVTNNTRRQMTASYSSGGGNGRTTLRGHPAHWCWRFLPGCRDAQIRVGRAHHQIFGRSQILRRYGRVTP